MRSLETAVAACEKYHPGLIGALSGVPFTERERPGSKVIDLFRAHDGAALLVPAELGGREADPLEAVRVMRAIGAHSPSLGAAATMHHFTVATLLALDPQLTRLTGRQAALMRRVAPERLLMASGWAEGRTEQNILNPSMTATPVDGGFMVNGSKKPCSLSQSMDLLTIGVALPGQGGVPELAMALLPADSAGISRHPFWAGDIMAGAESDEVRLENVFVEEELFVRATSDDPARFDDLQTAGFIWFELLITAAYTGVASALAARVLERGRGSVTDRATLGLRTEAAIALTEGMARTIRDGDISESTVAATLVTRFSVQELLVESAALAVELLGGMEFIGSSETAYLASAVRPLAFHPPSRTSTAEALVDFLAGRPLVLA
ncbi:acyl-CoA dehydrogenase family protein [Streptomyces sp. NPDC001634]|uniref:acyl-CoA dehydrogenase family protein n=1 Tax=Streptomyces sp. NPDC001634 TaxID=3154390 RepID=UPI00332345D5